MRILYPELDNLDEPLIDCLIKQGHQVYVPVFNNVLLPMVTDKPNITIFHIPSFTNGLWSIHEFQSHEYLRNIFYYIVNKYNIDVIFRVPAIANNIYPLNYMNKLGYAKLFPSKSLDVLFNKSEYLRVLRDKGYDFIPKRYDVIQETEDRLPTVEFPCISKPSLSSGSTSVVVFETYEQVEHFLRGNNKPENKYQEKVRVKMDSGIYRSYLFVKGSGDCAFDQYISGDTVSVSGVYNGNTAKLHMVYDIEPVELPYRSELAFSYPSNYYHLENYLTEIMNIVCRELEVPPGPIMADFVIDGVGKPWFIDFAPRISCSAAFMMGKAGKLDSFVTESLNPDIDADVLHLDPMYLKKYCFPKGVLRTIYYPDETNSEIVHADRFLGPGSRIYEPRMDKHLNMQGMVMSISENLSRAKELVNHHIASTIVEYE